MIYAPAQTGLARSRLSVVSESEASGVRVRIPGPSEVQLIIVMISHSRRAAGQTPRPARAHGAYVAVGHGPAGGPGVHTRLGC